MNEAIEATNTEFVPKVTALTIYCEKHDVNVCTETIIESGISKRDKLIKRVKIMEEEEEILREVKSEIICFYTQLLKDCADVTNSDFVRAKANKLKEILDKGVEKI